MLIDDIKNELDNIVLYDEVIAFSTSDYYEFIKKNYQELKEDSDLINKLNIIGYIELNIHDRCIYLFTYKEHVYASVDKCPILFWYKLNKSIDISKIYEHYNGKEQCTSKCIRSFIGTEDMLNIDIDDIENHFIINRYSDSLMWGSNWTDYPFRQHLCDNIISTNEAKIIHAQALSQLDDEEYNVSIKTRYSRSIVTIEDHDGAFILNIKYNPISKTSQIKNINKELKRNYKGDMPIDIILLIINFPFISHTDLLTLKPLTCYNFIISQLVANTKEMYNELIPIIEKINTDEENTDIGDMASSYLRNIKVNRLLNKIMNDPKTQEFIDENPIDLAKEYIMDMAKKEVDEEDMIEYISEIIENMFT